MPIKLLNFSILKSITLFFWEAWPVILNLLASPPQILIINPAAISKPSLIELGSMPLSNLYLASVLMFNSRAVYLIDEGKK